MAFVIMDDTSPSISYSGGWTSAGGPCEFNHTAHGSTRQGEQAVVHFSGSFIEVYGTLPLDDNRRVVKVSFDIDNINDGAAGVNVVPFQTLDRNLYHTQFYRSSSLKQGDHVLTIQVQSDTGIYFWLDYVLTDTSRPPSSTGYPANSHSTSPGPPATPSTERTPPAADDGPTIQPASSAGNDRSCPIPPTAESTPPSDFLPPGATAGVILGVITIFILVVTASIIKWRQRSLSRSSSTVTSTNSGVRRVWETLFRNFRSTTSRFTPTPFPEPAAAQGDTTSPSRRRKRLRREVVIPRAEANANDTPNPNSSVAEDVPPSYTVYS